MISSTMPLAGRLDWHPVHRASALLRRALLSSTATSPDPAEVWDDPTLRYNPAPTGLEDGSTSITYPASLAAMLGLPKISDQDMSCQPAVTRGPDASAPNALLEDISEGDAMLDGTGHAQLQDLVQAFYRRQRQASLIVACSVVTASVLTLVGLALLFNLTSPKAADGKDGAPTDGTSMAWTAPRAVVEMAILDHVPARATRPAKAAPLLIRAKAGTSTPSHTTSGAQVIRAIPGRPLALAPLLPRGHARYLLLRGLPAEAELSAGRRTGPGTWMVKGEEASDLALTLGKRASGDYPLEVYQLDTGNGPQARHRLILRVDQAPQVYAAGLNPVWPLAVRQTPQAPEAAAEPAAMSVIEASVLRERAQRLLGEGNIAAARLLLTRAAEQGHGNAAYELALTYDREVLAKAGIHGIDSDAGVARAWYEYAAQEGHAGAGQRLQTLARRRAAS